MQKSFAISRSELSALSSLVCDSQYARTELRRLDYAATADNNKRASDTLREALYRTGIWDRPRKDPQPRAQWVS